MLISSVTLMMACEKDNGGSASLSFAMIDAPGEYDEVWVDVQNVQVLMPNGNGDTSWTSINGFSPQPYDLIQLTNGNQAFLGELSFPEGELGQVRLVLGDDNFLIEDGKREELKVPSGSQSGYKVLVNERVEADFTYTVIIDFDAARSVVATGKESKYILKPVLRAELDAASGAISGVVLPDSADAVVYAIQNGDSISTIPASNGAFVLGALAPGTYELVLSPVDTVNYIKVSKSGVSVSAGSVTSMDTLDIAK